MSKPGTWARPWEAYVSLVRALLEDPGLQAPDLADATGLNLKVVNKHLSWLYRAGVLYRHRNKHSLGASYYTYLATFDNIHLHEFLDDVAIRNDFVDRARAIDARLRALPEST